MAKKTSRPEPSITQDLCPLRCDCPHCGQLMWADYSNRRTIATLAGLTRLNLTVRRCHNPDCPACHRPYRPEAEGRIALPRHEFAGSAKTPTSPTRPAVFQVVFAVVGGS